MDAYQLPAWVFKRDGRLVAFEADKISQSLFAASEAMGKPSAFLARELTDGVLHFLVQEIREKNPSTEQIADIVVKVTRELGHPDLARAYEQARPGVGACAPVPATAHTLVDSTPHPPGIFTRDLASAFQEGLLQLPPCPPFAVDALVLEPRTNRLGWGEALLEELVRLKEEVGRTFVLDSPDRLLPASDARAWTRHLCLLLEALDRQAIINLSTPSLPNWAREGAGGPLFAAADVSPASVPSSAREILDALLTLPPGCQRVRVDWHVPEKGPDDPTLEPLYDLMRRLPHCHWTLDRFGQETSLGEGLDRQHPCVLLEVGLQLSRFLHLDGIDGNVDRFLQKLPSLTHMAISAAVQKRSFVSRRHSMQNERPSHLAQGFLLFRARVLVRAEGVDEVIRQALGVTGPESRAGLDLEQRILKGMEESALHHGRARNLEAIVDRTGHGTLAAYSGSTGHSPAGRSHAEWLGWMRNASKKFGLRRLVLAQDPRNA